jgi:hypothetical protein
MLRAISLSEKMALSVSNLVRTMSDDDREKIGQYVQNLGDCVATHRQATNQQN